MTELVPLLADVEDFITFIVIVIFMILGAVGQLVNKAKEAKRKGPPRRPPQRPAPPRGPRRAGAGQPVAQPQQGPLQDEIGDFLRGAARRRDRVRAEAAGQAGARGGQQFVDAEVVEAPDEHVVVEVQDPFAREHLGRLSAELDQERTHADDLMTEHVHDVFDHELGRLSWVPGGVAGTPKTEGISPLDDQGESFPATIATDLATMLADPGNLRQAIVLSEIIQRPESRWS